MPTLKVYEAFQAAAKGQAFLREYDDIKREYDDIKREYDDIKQDFYDTRAYFNNTHENMTDVWECGRVTGADRWEHATPKPIQLIERIIKTSCQEHGSVLEPFLGSGTTLIACHNLDRICFGTEIDPGYCAVILQRFQDHTGIEPEMLDT